MISTLCSGRHTSRLHSLICRSPSASPAGAAAAGFEPISPVSLGVVRRSGLADLEADGRKPRRSPCIGKV
jgi:hypothetical protein